MNNVQDVQLKSGPNINPLTPNEHYRGRNATANL